MVRSILSEADAREIEAAVARVESASATELVIAVLPSSGNYFTFRAAVALGWGLGSAFVIHWIFPWLAVPWLLLLQPVVIGLVYAACGWGPIYRALIPPLEAERAVAQRAFALFAERGVHRTRDRTGLLVFISELEHRVVILGDSGIHDRVGDGGWTEHVSHLVMRIREGKAKEGLLEVIEGFTPLLAEIAPRRHDDTNELPDAVVRE